MARDNNTISEERFKEAVEAVSDALRAAQVAQQKLVRGITEQQTLQRFKEIREVIGSTRDQYGRLNSAVTDYNEKLVIMNKLLAEGDINQVTFNKALSDMDLQLAKNTEGAEQFASTVASGFSQGILSGEKLEDILARIGDRLIEATLQAAIFRGIMAQIGGGGGPVFGVPLPFDDPSAGASGTLGPTGGGPPPTLVGTTSPSTTTTNRSGGTTQVINIDARASDPGVEARVLRAIQTANQQNQIVIANNDRELRRRV